MTLVNMRDRALSPALYADVVPEGVLKRIGFAAWEQPPTATGGGYMHFLHQLEHQAGHMDEYNLYLSSLIRAIPGFATKARMEALFAALLSPPYGTMDMAGLATGGVYDAGSSLTLQNTVFAPVQTSQIAVPTNYDYKPEIDAILAVWNKSLTLHIGFANAPEFLTGSLFFNNDNALQCRAAENGWRNFVDFTTYNIAVTDHVNPTYLFGADAQTAIWPHATFDLSKPAVYDLCLDHIADLVTEYGTGVRYTIHGESSVGVQVGIGEGGTGEITTNFSADAVDGFRNYMENYLGLTIGQANARWGTAYLNYAAVDPSTALFGGLDEQYADYLAYQSFVTSQIADAELRHALATNPDIEASCFRFGPAGMEKSWLQSRYGSVGDWLGQPVDEYLRLRDFGMSGTARAARLSGVPCAFPITAPAYIIDQTPAGQDAVPPILRAYRTYGDAEMGLLISDLMTAGEIGIAYLKAPMASFGANPQSVDAVKRVIQTIRTGHSAFYARSGPLNKLVVHSDTMELANTTTGTGGGRVSYWLGKVMHNYQPAIFSDSRVKTRTLARSAMSRALTIVTFPTTLVATKDDYVALYPQNSTGAAIILAYSTGGLPAYVNPAVIGSSWYGNLYRVFDGATPTNVFYFEVKLVGQCNRDTFMLGLAETLDNSFIPLVIPFIAASGTIPFALAPFDVATLSPKDISVNYTTDGINFTVHISNLSDQPIDVAAGVQSGVATALGVTYVPFSSTVPPKLTTIATLEADFAGISTLAASLTDATTKLGAVGAGFDVTKGQELIAQATTLLPTHPSRALAAYIAAARMVYIKTDWAAPNLTVTARRITLPTEGAGPENVSGARVQVLFPLNAREEQAVEGTTNGSGVATIVVGAPVIEVWDVATHDMVAPAATANDHVEVHVTDSRGMSTRKVVLTP